MIQIKFILFSNKVHILQLSNKKEQKKQIKHGFFHIFLKYATFFYINECKRERERKVKKNKTQAQSIFMQKKKNLSTVHANLIRKYSDLFKKKSGLISTQIKPIK